MRQRSRCLAAALAVLALTGTPAFGQRADTEPGDDQVPVGAARALEPEGGGWLTALGHSFALLGIEHGTRLLFQEKTRRELRGPFFSDYRRSVHIPTDWEDGDSWFVNYVGHPIHGAAAGYLWRDAAGRLSSQDLGVSRRYWGSLGRSAAWIGVYSFQFEIGPLSEASIGNVGLTEDTRGWVDHVVTPAVGLGFMVLEDSLDKYFLTWVERHVRHSVLRAVLRVVFNPGRALANSAQGRWPWHRAGRSIR